MGYTYDHIDILREARASATINYVNGPGIDEPLAKEEAGGVLVFYHADVLGSVGKVTDAAGAIALTRRYDGWGGLEVGVGESGYAFTGREWDPETGLCFYRARYYDPKVGRFLSEDPVGQAFDVNLYGYVRNQPVRLIDPSGKVPARGGNSWTLCFPIAGEGPATLAFLYYASRSFNEIPNTDGRTRDRERHCWAACMTKRLFGCNVLPEFVIILAEGFGGIPANGFEDSWKDAAAHYWGVWVYIKNEDCMEACLRCPLIEEGR